MPPPAFRSSEIEFSGSPNLYPTLKALFSGEEISTCTCPSGKYTVLDSGRHLSGHHDGLSDGYYYLLRNEQGDCGWCWQHAMHFFTFSEDETCDGEVDLRGPIQTEIESRYAVGDRVEVPQSFVAWSELQLAQDPYHSWHKICDGGRYQIVDVGVFESEGEMCLDNNDIDLERLNDIANTAEMPFYLLRDLASFSQRWTYEFLLLRAVNGQSAEEMLREFGEVAE